VTDPRSRATPPKTAPPVHRPAHGLVADEIYPVSGHAQTWPISLAGHRQAGPRGMMA